MSAKNGASEAPAEKGKILNLTQHPATPDQVAAGVVEPKDKARVRELLTFNELPTPEELKERVKALTEIVLEEGFSKAMIGGAPYLMYPLEIRLRTQGILPLYAFSKREIEEIQLPDGSVKKTLVFKHLGFVKTY